VEKIVSFLKEFGILITMGIMGIGLVIYGVVEARISEETKVEIVKADEREGKEGLETANRGNEIVVDIAGAVEKPGLYKISRGSRIGDVIVRVGGLASNADLDWVAQTLNLAEVIEDGEKIYIPRISLNIDGQPIELGKVEGSQTAEKVNINKASLSELDALTGIGEVRAGAIIDNRPYSKTEELVSKANIPESVYNKIKDQVSVY